LGHLSFRLQAVGTRRVGMRRHHAHRRVRRHVRSTCCKRDKKHLVRRFSVAVSYNRG
jgi:hypothetical protein